jgi:5-methylcytosine-specific restriction protein A
MSLRALFFWGDVVTTEEIVKIIKAGQTKKFYKSRRWKYKRRQILKRDNHECQRCKREGKYSKATTVHHKEHLEKRPDLALVDENLESLCSACHNEEHPEKLKKVEVDRREHITPERW